MKNGFTIADTIPARASEIYQAWLSSEGHAAMTGNPAEVDGTVGGKFSALDGYIHGSALALIPNQRIVQAWRTTEIPEESPDSHLEVLLEETDGGTKVNSLTATCPKTRWIPIGKAGRIFISSE